MLHPYLKYIQTQVADSNVGTYLLDIGKNTNFQACFYSTVSTLPRVKWRELKKKAHQIVALGDDTYLSSSKS